MRIYEFARNLVLQYLNDGDILTKNVLTDYLIDNDIKVVWYHTYGKSYSQDLYELGKMEKYRVAGWKEYIAKGFAPDFQYLTQIKEDYVFDGIKWRKAENIFVRYFQDGFCEAIFSAFSDEE